MSISINGQNQVPPGFRFHPTEEELLQYYLKKKVAQEIIDLDVIRDVDLNKLEPWDIQEKCRVGSTPQSDWYFFSHKDKKYPTGTRTNRATASGFWKATGRDKAIYSSSTRIGMRKTLVFYKGRAPQGQKSDWIMHEYRLHDNTTNDINTDMYNNDMKEQAQEEGWVICRIFKKKMHHNKFIHSPRSVSGTTSLETKIQMTDQGTLEQILLDHVSRQNKAERKASYNTRRFPALDSGVDANDRFSRLPCLEMFQNDASFSCPVNNNGDFRPKEGINDWASLDLLIASHLNGQNDMPSSKQFCSSTNLFPIDQDCLTRDFQSTKECCEESDIWSFMRQSLSPNDELGDMTNVPNSV
ncbi:hypothetical protein LIER_37547 [Lithospermum erythrorhizon]|uniref:NAC domain-containing protein n=1 Tax=Lithospermum erythrorhizon TaxID=34254 RepID=A0AAV3PM18_LITER